MLTHLDLFSGIGGFALAAQWAGFQTIAFCEKEPFCQKVLAKHWPGVPIHDDIRTLTPEIIWDNQMAGKPRKLTYAQFDECVALYEAGASCGEIAQAYNVSRQSMHDVLKRRTVMRPKEQFGAENRFFRGGSTEDDHAQNMVEYAVRIGRLIRPDACEQCGKNGTFKDGRTAIQAHHSDYNKPLEVIWLCQKCHHEWHKCNSSIGKEVMPKEVPCQIDLLTGGFP